jgi:hypothetical protein
MNNHKMSIIKEIKKIALYFTQEYKKINDGHEQSVYVQVLSHILISYIKNIFIKNNFEQESITYFNKEYSFLFSGTKLVKELLPEVIFGEIENWIKEEFKTVSVDTSLMKNLTGQIKKISTKISGLIDIQKAIDEYFSLSLKSGGFGNRNPDTMKPFATRIANIIAFPLYLIEKADNKKFKNLGQELLLFGMVSEDFILKSKKAKAFDTKSKKRNFYHGVFLGNEFIDKELFVNFMQTDSFKYLKPSIFHPLFIRLSYLFVRYYDLKDDFNYVMNRSKIIIEKDIAKEEIYFLTKILDQVIIEKVMPNRTASLRLKEYGLYSSKESRVVKSKGGNLTNKTVGFKELTSEEMKKQFRKALNPIIQKWLNE